MDMQDKMIVSSALDRLISGETEDWQVDAQDVVVRCVGLPESDDVSYSLEFGRTNDKNAAGYAAGVGNVSLQEKGRSELREEYRGFHRIGNYRIIHSTSYGTIVAVPYREFGVHQNLIDMAEAPIGALIPGGYVLQYDEEHNPAYFFAVFNEKIGGMQQLYMRLRLWLQDLPRSLRYSPSTIAVCLMRPSKNMLTLYPEDEKAGT